MNKQTHFNSSLEAPPATTSQVFCFQKNVRTFYCSNEFFLWRKYSFSAICYFQFNAMVISYLDTYIALGAFRCCSILKMDTKHATIFKPFHVWKKNRRGQTYRQLLGECVHTYMYYVRISSTKGSYKSLFLIFGSNQRNVIKVGNPQKNIGIISIAQKMCCVLC